MELLPLFLNGAAAFLSRGSDLYWSVNGDFTALRIGLILGTSQHETVEEAIAGIVEAEQDGFASVWRANVFGLDALTVLALAATKTSRIELGTAVVPTYPRHPHSLAQQAATVAAAAKGRFVLGLGRSHQVVIETMFGLDYNHAITHMREYLTAVRSLVADGAVSLNGKQYSINAPLDVPGSSGMPLMIGALMPKMLEVCGELCDGTLTWMAGPKYVADTIVPTLQRSSDAAGRAMPRVVVSLPVCVTDDRVGAREVAASRIGFYGTLPVYRACLDAEGAAEPMDVALIGNEEQVREGLARVRDAGATDFYGSVFPDQVGGSSARSLEFLRSLGGSL